VSDGKLSSEIVTTTVTAALANVAPVANAGTYQNVVVRTIATLNGTGSTDANPGDTLTYKWVMVSRPLASSATLSSDTASKPTFYADVVGDYVFSLQVNDGKLASNMSYVTVTAGAANVAPVANAGTAQTVARGATVTLDGSGSTDADNNVLIYRWTLTFRPTGSNAVLSLSSLQKPTFVADVAGVYVATLVVNDGSLDSNVTTVAVTATP